MSHSTKAYIKQHWISMLNFVILIILFLFKSGFTSGKEVTDIKTNIKQNGINIETNRINIKEHEDDEVVHMPFQEKIQIFVPRVELDSRLKNIEDALVRIEKNQNKR